MAEEPEAVVREPAESRATASGSQTASQPARHDHDWAFAVWGFASVLAVVVALSIRCLTRTDGNWAYVLDDTAIHLSMADTLRHGTWGITVGVYESASSSPVWTVLVTAATSVVPTGREFVPLALCVPCAFAILWLLGRSQDVVRPSSRRPLDVLVAVVLSVVVLFLPGLVLTGMEHALHAALVLAAVLVLHRTSTGDWPSSRRALAYVALAVAALTRFETLFVALGLMAGLAVSAALDAREGRRGRLVETVRTVVLVGTCTAVPVAGFALFNRAMGQELLPNSVVVKSPLRHAQLLPRDDILFALGEDPVVLVLFLVSLAYLVSALGAGGAPRRNVLPATTVVVTTLFHSGYADIGWFERYQAYVIVLGIATLLWIAGEVIDHDRLPAFLGVLVVGALVLTPLKVEVLREAPLASRNTYVERYQLGRFFGRYYEGQSVATGELGYASLFHDGPMLDVLGLGTHEVLEAIREIRYDDGFLHAVTERRGVQAVAMYSTSTIVPRPSTWVFVGDWELTMPRHGGGDMRLQFWAPDEDRADRLQAHFLEFAEQLPAGIRAVCWRCLDPGSSG